MPRRKALVGNGGGNALGNDQGDDLFLAEPDARQFETGLGIVIAVALACILDRGRKKIFHEIYFPRRLAPGNLEFFRQIGKLGIAPGFKFGMEPNVPFKGEFLGHVRILAGCRATLNQTAVLNQLPGVAVA
ncbi:MAG: hypothetical protein NTZ12_07685 [Candidatus Aminicenantes bacterium]|nr:hypothetical protein [Candidatus Aminicenantes bacterium]